MASETEFLIGEKEKIRIASDFIRSAPPGELNPIFTDVRVLFDDDALLNECVTDAIAFHSRVQLTPVKIDSHVTLITDYNDLGGGRFFDPSSKQSFKYDYFRREAIDIQPHDVETSGNLEIWIKALQDACKVYTLDHYKNGTSAVFGKMVDGKISLTACIEGHQYQPKNFWNGKWRSIWSVVFDPDCDVAELNGSIKAQVHYYEDGNVQLVTSKEVKESLCITSEKQTASEFVDIVKESEAEYQIAVGENYQTMSDTVFKALRRLLPVTRTKIDWAKIAVYKLGTELKN